MDIKTTAWAVGVLGGYGRLMKNGIDYFAKKFISEFQVSRYKFDVDTDNAKSIMSDYYLRPVWCCPLEKLLIAGSDVGRIKKHISFAEDMYSNGDDEIKGIVQWVMLEYFVGLHDIGMRTKFYKYLSQNLYEATIEVEIHLKDIHDKLYPKLNYRLYSAKYVR